jgi:hypothetical protein
LSVKWRKNERVVRPARSAISGTVVWSKPYSYYLNGVTMPDEVLILGATGRTGRGIAQRLDRAGVSIALYGRDRQRWPRPLRSSHRIHGS